MPIAIRNPYLEMVGKLVNASDSDLQFFWDLLIDYDHETFYDEQAGISMDEYAQAVHSEMDRRGMPHIRVLTARELAASGQIMMDKQWYTLKEIK